MLTILAWLWPLIAILPAQATTFTAAGAPRRVATVPPLTESDFTARVGPGPFDRIGLHHLALARTGTRPARGVVLYLPGTNMNGELPLIDPDHWLPLYLAVRGIDVWSMDYRTRFVPPGTAPAGLAELGRWTDGLFTADVRRAASFVLRRSGARALFVAGFSKGAEFAYLYAASRPRQVRGLVILDGYLFGRLPGSNAGKGGPGRYADDIGGRHLTYQRRQALLRLVIRDPQAPAPLPRFKTAARNLEHVVYSAAAFGGHGGLANPYGGFSDPVTLARVLLTYDRYWPAVQAREDPATSTVLRQLAASKIPVIAFASTNIGPGWVSEVKASAARTDGEVTISILRGWGHLDVLCGTHAARKVYAPVLAFIRRHAAWKDSRRSPGRAGRDRAAAGRSGLPPAPTSQSRVR